MLFEKTDPAHLALLVGFTLLTCGSTLAQDVHYNFMPGTDFLEVPHL